MRATILIPALNPTSDLLRVVDELLASSDVLRVVVVNDGSAATFLSVFEELGRNSRVEVLRHAVNIGKGAALRLGINHFLCTAKAGERLVTADADGQHLPKDILAVAEAADKSPGSLVLGARQFCGDVPLRSRFGNDLTRLMVRLFIGQALPDTQTGLRAIPCKLMLDLLRVKATGYEFELEMLILAARAKVPIVSVTIETVYLAGNATSHFDPIRDSARIYFVFARFISSSAITAVLDYLVFTLAYQMTHSLSLAIVLGRLVAGTLNFTVNKSLVFRSNGDLGRSLTKYIALVAALGAIAYALIQFLVVQWSWNAYWAKITVEGFLLLCSFVLQRDLVFTTQPTPPSDDEQEN